MWCGDERAGPGSRFWRCAVGLLILWGCVTDDASPVEGTATPPPTTLPSFPTPMAAPPDLSARPLAWLTAQPYLSRPPDFEGGSTDFFELFDPGPAWEAAAEQIHVYKMYDQLGLGRPATNEEWVQVIEGVEERGMALAMELGPLPESQGCGGGEGFGGSYSISLVDLVQHLGGQVDVVVFDGPYGFGHFYDGTEPEPCNWSLEKIADESAAFVSELREVEPNVVVGGLEPLWEMITPDDIADWLDAYQAAAGEPLAFFHLDIDWNRPDWAETTLAIEQLARERGIPFGIIYNGGEGVGSDEEWIDAAVDRMLTYEQIVGGRPEHVIFQSWHEYPSRTLPEDDPNTLTGMVNRYFSPRPDIGVEWTSGPGTIAVEGEVTTSEGSPIVGGSVLVDALPLDGVPQRLQLTGTVPEGSGEAILAIRVNAEGAGPGEADIRLYEVSYRQGGGDNLTENPDFASGTSGWAIYGDGEATVEASDTGSGNVLRLVSDPARPLSLDSTYTVAVEPGAEFELAMTAAVPFNAADTGYIAVVFADATSEVDRAILPFAPARIDLGTANTGADGRFELESPVLPGTYRVSITLPGGIDHWPARQEIEVLSE